MQFVDVLNDDREWFWAMRGRTEKIRESYRNCIVHNGIASSSNQYGGFPCDFLRFCYDVNRMFMHIFRRRHKPIDMHACTDLTDSSS